jgi:hypothetical protein
MIYCKVYLSGSVVMKYFVKKKDNYERIIEILCGYKGITREELYSILKDSECRYVLFLLLKKYDCVDVDILNRDFSIKTLRRVNYNVKRAEEKLLLNKRIREIYFEAENILENAK